MKKINYNCVVFICVATLIVGGLFSLELFSGLKDALVGLFEDRDITTFISQVDEASANIRYKGSLLDLYSLYYRVRDVRVVEKPDSTVIRGENDYLFFEQGGLDTAALEEIGDRCVGLKEVADSVNADFLYVMAPAKSYFNKTADGTENIVQQEHAAFAAILKERGIRVLDLAEQMAQQNIVFEDAYFVTDHHWVPETGFWAAKQILQSLNIDQRFPYDEATYDLSNYDIEVYEDWFLGSIGKKVGRYFTPLGVDDISLITPKFNTKFTVTDSRGTLTGPFKDTLINMSHISAKDYYGKNPYAAYTGGDFGLQVIQNKYATEDAKKIVVIRDSFACCVTPFLALTPETTHVLDVRHWQKAETAQSIPDYIKAVNPDCVIVLYSLISLNMTDFSA